MEFAGYGCPLETAEIKDAADTDGADMRQLVKLLGVSQEKVKFEDLVSMAREHGLFERLIDSEGDLKPPVRSAFGKLLKRYHHRIFEGCNRFVVDGKGHSKRFRVVSESQALHGQHGQHGVLAG